ncbi:MAG: tyrosine-type recombinase/integrase [Chthoniobacterales bacterium]|nr:tyrosine-type recombinase/integrase [Chthoniobacterales bacterium]
MNNAALRNALGDRLGTGAAKSSVARLAATIRSLFRYLEVTEQHAANPAAILRGPKADERLPHWLEVDDVAKLIDSIAGGTEIALRDRAILETLYSTACRVGELVDLADADIAPTSGTVRLRGKGGKERLGVLGKSALRAIEAYQTVRRRIHGEGPALFVSVISGRRLSDRDVRRSLLVNAKCAGFKARITPHTFRHSCATHLMDNGASIRYVQEILGHASLNTTQIYTHTSTRKLVETYEKAHPRAV